MFSILNLCGKYIGQSKKNKRKINKDFFSSAGLNIKNILTKEPHKK